MALRVLLPNFPTPRNLLPGMKKARLVDRDHVNGSYKVWNAKDTVQYIEYIYFVCKHEKVARDVY